MGTEDFELGIGGWGLGGWGLGVGERGELRFQISNDLNFKLQIGSRKSAIPNRQLQIGNRKSAIPNRQSQIGNRNRQSQIGNRK